LAALAVPTPSFAQAPTFNALVTTSTNSSFNFPAFAAVGDFNGDGKLDALVTDGSESLRLMLGNGDGTFTEHDVSVPGTNPGPIKAADLNGDGKLDAVLTSNGTGSSTVLINTGNDGNGVPQFTTTNYPGGGRSVTIGDLNGGRPDFIVGDAFGGLQVFLNNGDGTFSAGQTTSLLPGAGGPSVGPGVIVDLNGDGKADYVVASNQNQATNVFFGNGDGTLQAPVVIPSFGLFLAVVDVNHDGKPDLIEVDPGSGDPSSGMLMVFLNSGDGTFSTPPTLFTSGCVNPFSVAIADFNGDGNLDVVIGDFNGGSGHQVAVLLGDGHGAFGAPTLYINAADSGALDVSVGDFNGDGKLDIAMVNRQTRTFGVLMNTTVNADSTPPVITAPASITIEATGAAGAAATFTATALDGVDGAVPVTATPPSGSVFPLGTTTVHLSAADAAHNTATGSFTVTVRDTTPPRLFLPVSITFEATGPSGAVVSYAPSATDIVDGSVPVTCAPLSGSRFALGTRQVACYATDAHGNKASGSFPVTVSDTKAPIATASLVAVRGGGDDESMQSFRVVFSATDLVGVKTLSASLNGITVTNGETVQLKIIKSGAQKTKRDDCDLQIQATSFTLTVTAVDAAGNKGTATAVPVFVKNGKDDDDRKDDDDNRGKDDRKG
jgi:uncharacterized protein (DUF2141 family)